MNRLPTSFSIDSLSDALVSARVRVDQALKHFVPAEDVMPERLHQAMHYSLFNGGKRVRPALVYFTGLALGASLEKLDAPAAAVELIHAYSLIHDDLPAMDDDDLRRGKPTCHRVFDDATAILAGDALQALAFGVLAQNTSSDVTGQVSLEMVRLLADAASSRGMVGGQVIDMESMGKQIDLPQLEVMHSYKTGALIRASVQLGALASPETTDEISKNLNSYAKSIGLAFQVHDDILDVIGNTEELGKEQGGDHALEKSTYPVLLGLPAAQELEQELIHNALEALRGFDERADLLRALARYIIERRN